jgi:radical SAM family RiPP maturation amino acid epimerase
MIAAPLDLPADSAFREFCAIKRFMERWAADRSFRERLAADPVGYPDPLKLGLVSSELRPLWDRALGERYERGELDLAQLPPAVLRFRTRIASLLQWRCSLRAAEPSDSRWRAWRARQMQRVRAEVSPASAEQIVFATSAYELSKGCSVGCWFCGVSAPQLTDHFLRTPQHARLFREVLEAVGSYSGTAAVESNFLYWASDPLDNPDYEGFADDFRGVFGTAPLFTTALALRDPERTRRLVASVFRFEGERPRVDRFSVLTLRQLEQIHALFSPEELACIECVSQNREGVVVKANAGRFRERAARSPKVAAERQQKLSVLARGVPGHDGPGTIACVAGFLFNMVERSVKLIAPCNASERWPLGYIVFAEGRFGSGAELRALLERIVDEHMPQELPPQHRVRLQSSVRYEPVEHGFALRANHAGVRCADPARPAYFAELGERIRAGAHGADEIAAALLARHGVWPEHTSRTLEQLFAKGYLCEEPLVEPAHELPVPASAARAGGPPAEPSWSALEGGLS